MIIDQCSQTSVDLQPGNVVAGEGQRASSPRLRISFICCSYPPEREPTGVMAAQLAGALSRHGHEITMIVPYPNRPGGKLYPGYRRSGRTVEIVDGVRVVRCPTWLIGPGRNPVNRVLENLSFGVIGAIVAALEPRPDILISETWPLAATQISILLAKARGIPVLEYVKDIYPEVIENGKLIRKDGWIARLLRAWDRSLCMASEHVIVISNGMRDTLVTTRQLPTGRVVVIPDWIDESEFRPLPRENAWRNEIGIPPEKFLALFAGTLGIVSGADILIETAARLRNCPDILVLCVGEGVLKDHMMIEAARRGLRNIRFEPFQDRARVPEMHAASDVCVLTMRKDYSNASVPSKLISYMAAGRPVICATGPETDVAKGVAAARAGLVVPPGDADSLAQAILSLRVDPRQAAEMGANSRSYFERMFAFGPRYEQFISLISETARRR